MKAKKVVIIGAGSGGLVAANKLRRLLSGEHEIIVIDQTSIHSFAPSFLWVMVGTRTLNQVTRPIGNILRPNIKYIHASVQSIDLSKRAVKAKGAVIPFDYLVIASGAEPAFDSIPGFDDSVETFFTAEGSKRLFDSLRNFGGGKIALAWLTPYKCPGAPHEGAMLIADFLRRKRKIENFEIHLFTPESQPLPVAGPKLGTMVKEVLESRGIIYHPSHKLTSVDSSSKILKFENNPDFLYNMLILIPPHRSARFVQDSGLANAAGWISVDRNTLATPHENIYAIGDVTAISIPGRWKADVPLMLPKAGVFAHSQALVVAERVASEISGRRVDAQFCGDGFCMLEAGEDLAGFAYGNFFAEPSPDVKLKKVGRSWHLGKILFEKWWLAPYGIRRALLESAITTGGKILGVPVKL
jgi:sulfide:quinone oxidoreductase